MRYSVSMSGIEAAAECDVYAAMLPKKQDLLAIAGLGACLYLNQLCYIIGIDLSGVLVATCMQPAIPVFTAMLAVLLHIEVGSWQKAAGIAAAVTGSVCMVRPPRCPLLQHHIDQMPWAHIHNGCKACDRPCWPCFCTSRLAAGRRRPASLPPRLAPCAWCTFQTAFCCSTIKADGLGMHDQWLQNL